jgi:membrane fusion protein, multidrug efflux system
MNLLVSTERRSFTILIVIVVALAIGGVLGMPKVRVNIFNPLQTPEAPGYLGSIGVRAEQTEGHVVSQFEPSFANHKEQPDYEHRKIVLTSPKAMDVTITQPYVGQIHAHRDIKVCTLAGGYLEQILVREGQRVTKGDVMFKIVPTLYQARRDAKSAEAKRAQLEYNQTKKLSEGNLGKAVVSQNDVAQFEAKLAMGRANAERAQAELNFANVTAPFDGIVDRAHEQVGSLIKEGGILTTLSDNSVMWVYFNVPEKQYLQYMAARQQHEQEDKIELELADHTKFPQSGKIGAIGANFNNETGNIPFRADFPNPNGLLRHGQTGTILIHRNLHDAIVIPMRATYEILDRRYVNVVDKDDVVQQREIIIQDQEDDIFVIKKGVGVGDRIVLNGIGQVCDGEKVEYEFLPPEQVIGKLKNHAE